MPQRSIPFWWKTALATALVALLSRCRRDGGGGAAPRPAADSAAPAADLLDAATRAELLQLVRTTIAAYLAEQRIPPYQTTNPRLLQSGGAFVTLKKRGALRGCIGHLAAERPVYETIQEMAVSAATRDPRFPPVSAEELADLTIEISLLSPLETVPDPEQIVVGKHGLLIRQGWYQGVLLPQVAPEQGWSREAFLQSICYKAGLPADAWQSPGTELYWFTAEVFGEEPD